MRTRPIRRTLLALVVGAVGVPALVAMAGCGTQAGRQPPGSAQPATAGVPMAVPTAELADALSCPPGTAVTVRERVDLPTDHRSTVLAAHCQSAAGSPPDGVFLVVEADGGTRLADVLVPASAQVEVSALVRSSDGVRMSGRGYSGPDVPRCCPDVAVSRSWQLVGDRLVPQQ